MEYPTWIKRYRAGEPFTVDDFADAIESLLDALDRTIETLDQQKETPHMGAFDTADNVTLPNPDDAKASADFRKKWKWDAHEQVILKGAYTGIEQEAVDNASADMHGKGRKQALKMRLGTARNKLLEVMILDWTFTQKGHKLPVTPENIVRLPVNYRTPILEMCDQLAMTMDEEEQDAFLPSVSEPTKEN